VDFDFRKKWRGGVENRRWKQRFLELGLRRLPGIKEFHFCAVFEDTSGAELFGRKI
jgi:hypothetical protein